MQEEKAKERRRALNRRGRQATLLTAGPGIAGDATVSGEPAVARPTLLGGGYAA